MSRLFLAHWAASDPQAGPAALEDPAGFHLNPERPQMPARIQGIPLPPDRPELNPVEAGGDVTKDRIGSTLGATLAALAAAAGEEVRPVYESAERVRSLVSHPWLIDQGNAAVTMNSAIIENYIDIYTQ